MGGFKKQATQPLLSKAISESEFENGGRATKIDSAPKLKRYQNSENAKRIETQTYIFTQALNAWLDSKGFEK